VAYTTAAPPAQELQCRSAALATILRDGAASFPFNSMDRARR
jgi:hypothetical protein